MVVQKRRKIGRAIAMTRFPFWRRTGRAETERRPERKKAEEESVADSREFDRDGEGCWSYWGEPLRDIGWTMRFSIHEHIAKLIGRYSKERPFKVLDLGCGPGSALATLKRLFGEKIKTVGLVLERTPEESYRGVDRLVSGRVDFFNPHETYDLIYSYFGAAHHSNLKLTAIEKVIKFLKPGGTAAIELGIVDSITTERIDKTTLKEIRTLFAQNGIRKATFGKRVGIMYVRFQKPFSKLP